VLLGSQTVGFDAFNAAGVAAKTVSLQLPGIATAGSYFLIVEVFPTAYCDQNYQNNTLVGPQIEVVGQPSGAYCGAQGEFPWHDWIAGVSVADLANGSGKSPYSDFSALTATLMANTSAPLTLTAGFSWTAFDEYWKIWIDYDHDGTFDEPGEIAFQQYMPKPSDGTPTATLSGSIAVPASALPGSTRMRVAMRRGGAPEPCESFAFGEVEDYSVNIISSFQAGDARATAAPSAVAMDFNLFPNPTNGEFIVSIEDGWSGQARLFDLYGRILTEQKMEQETRFDLSAQPAGIYWLDIRFDNMTSRCEKIIKE
jgi:hypothetical protein